MYFKPTVVNLETSPSAGPPAKTLVVLGSGKHATEILDFVSALYFSRYTPRMYVIADSDTTSAGQIESLETERAARNYEVISKSRNVEMNKSWISFAIPSASAIVNYLYFLLVQQSWKYCPSVISDTIALLFLLIKQPDLVISSELDSCVQHLGSAASDLERLRIRTVTILSDTSLDQMPFYPNIFFRPVASTAKSIPGIK